MQISVLGGIYTDQNSDFRVSYPRNLVPVISESGISAGYLRPADGLVQLGGTMSGIDRGGINWNGVCYRVIGSQLVSVSSTGVVSVLGDVGAGGSVTFDYSFSRLAIASSNRLYYWDGASFTQVTDADLGLVVDFVWVDGFFLVTDGTTLAVTELNDPFAVSPLKYGSSEADPDPIKALLKVRNEVYALNRYTIEVFNNVGGSGFPFARIEGAQMQRGSVGTYSCAYYNEGVAFLGGGRNEPVAVWFGANSSTVKLSSREIDLILQGYTESQLSGVLMETRITTGQKLLYVHLPDQCLVYDIDASRSQEKQVWHVLTSSITGLGQYKAKNFVWCYDKWIFGDPTQARLGYLSEGVSSHYGELNGWDFGTQIVYNEGRGAIFHEIELVCLSGRAALGADPTIWTSYSTDGITWSLERPRSAGKQGQTAKRINWLQQGNMRHWRVQRFRGTSDSHLSVARIEARLEPLNV